MLNKKKVENISRNDVLLSHLDLLLAFAGPSLVKLDKQASKRGIKTLRATERERREKRSQKSLHCLSMCHGCV